MQKNIVFETEDKGNSQLQQGAVGIAIAKLLFALLLQVALQGSDSLGVVTLEAVDDGRDVLGPLGRIFAVHGVGEGGGIG